LKKYNFLAALLFAVKDSYSSIGKILPEPDGK